ncbi:MAG TPA: AAA family ATPase, partial [Candidatus Hydrogenedentes bacterium]|nr:AAA family ATPase [Candidatus Hydrogenedentota bacterium]
MSQLAQGDYGAKLDALKANLGKAIQGKSECIDLLTIAVIANGSVLMEDVPGVGKTTLAKALAQSIDAEMSRIQFTPDLLPADILGASIYNPSDGTFHFRRGPIFCNVLLADEINRASPRTQSALLEAMNEWQTTIEGQRYLLPEPFLDSRL